MIRRIGRILASGLVGLAGMLAHADESEMVTDRPDQTESSSVVPARHLQIEAGVVYGESDTSETVEGPGTLLRYGVNDTWEFRLAHPGYTVEDVDGSDRSEGWGDGEVGTKVALQQEAGWRPEAALLGSISLPGGDDEMSSDQVDPAFRFSLAHTLNDRFSLGYNLGGEWTSVLDADGERDRIGAFIYTLALGIGLSDSVGAYVEAYGDLPEAPEDEAHRVDGGFTWAVLNNCQLDISGGVGLGDVSDEWFVGTGLSVRWPN